MPPQKWGESASCALRGCRGSPTLRRSLWFIRLASFLIVALTLGFSSSSLAGSGVQKHHHAVINPITGGTVIAAGEGQQICGSNKVCIEDKARHACLRTHNARACRLWHRLHGKPPQAHVAAPPGLNGIPGYTPFDACVAQHESGGDWTIATGNGYFGAFQWLPSTWVSVLAMMGVSGPSDPAAASPVLQVAAFNYWSARDPGAWPVTIPACGG